LNKSNLVGQLLNSILHAQHKYVPDRLPSLQKIKFLSLAHRHFGPQEPEPTLCATFLNKSLLKNLRNFQAEHKNTRFEAEGYLWGICHFDTANYRICTSEERLGRTCQVFLEYRYRSPRFWWSLSLSQELHCGSRPTHAKEGRQHSTAIKTHTQISDSSSTEYALLSSTFSLSRHFYLSPSSSLFNLPHAAERFLLARAYTNRNVTSLVRIFTVHYSFSKFLFLFCDSKSLQKFHLICKRFRISNVFGLRGSSRKNCVMKRILGLCC